MLRLPEDGEDALKLAGVLTIHKMLLICVCCASVDVGNKLCKMHGTYIKIILLCS